ncbi:two-component sensor histidine kinase [Solihabitans fulvus]|uniref:histidine kinase n=2 Tax=Solihabitans fulvus TaxID=1892852 RepID=A0A5B2XD00_9PSEU|nr:two-component sensor histidine kinase [Solihabitans fulvus]
MIVVVWAAWHAHPGPGLSGRELAVSVALGAFVLGGIGGVLAMYGRPGMVHVALIVVLLLASAALMWLQPDGVGVAGVFVGVSLLAPLLRGRPSTHVTVVVLVFLCVMVAASLGGSFTTALLNAVMLSAYYGMFFLSMRLGDANRLAQRLVSELEQSRAAEARAAGLAERQRLAREMHDVLAHSLSGLMLQLEGARMLLAENPDDPRLPEVVDRAHHLGKSGLEEARRAIGMLRDDELPGPESLAGLAAQFQQDRGVPCRLTISGAAHQLDSEARLALYRVAQEALTNIAKHADPARVELCLAYEPTRTRLTVEDFANNRGARRPAPGDSGGYGLTGMRERAELLGGTLVAGPTDGGFRVELDVPT